MDKNNQTNDMKKSNRDVLESICSQIKILNSDITDLSNEMVELKKLLNDLINNTSDQSQIRSGWIF
jgi:predicted transcriptional regulator